MALYSWEFPTNWHGPSSSSRGTSTICVRASCRLSLDTLSKIQALGEYDTRVIRKLFDILPSSPLSSLWRAWFTCQGIPLEEPVEKDEPPPQPNPDALDDVLVCQYVFGRFNLSHSPRKSLVFYLNPLLVIECCQISTPAHLTLKIQSKSPSLVWSWYRDSRSTTASPYICKPKW